MREKAKGVKADRCPGCGRACAGRLQGVRTIGDAEIGIFAFVCDECSSVWVRAELPKKRRKRL